MLVDSKFYDLDIVKDIIYWKREAKIESVDGQKIVWRIINPVPCQAAFYAVDIHNSPKKGLAEDMEIWPDGKDLIITTVAL